MPDLSNHLLVAYVARRLLPEKDLDSTYYLGALLPDLLTRPFHILMPRTSAVVEALHSPAALLAACWATSLVFAAEDRARVQRGLLWGVAVHLGLDLIQKHVVGGYLLLYPLSVQATTGGLLWPDQSPALLAITVPLALGTWWWNRRSTASGA